MFKPDNRRDPATSNVVPGVLVPIPTLPVAVTRRRSVAPVVICTVLAVSLNRPVPTSPVFAGLAALALVPRLVRPVLLLVSNDAHAFDT